MNTPATGSTPVYLSASGDLYINAPLSTVWPYLLDYTSWQDFSISRRVAGDPNQEGEVVLLKKVEAGLEFPPFYARTIILSPHKRIVWKTYSEKGGPLDFFGIVDFRVSAQEGRTTFHFETLYEFNLPGSSAAAEEFRATQSAEFERVYASILPKLKALAEAQS